MTLLLPPNMYAFLPESSTCSPFQQEMVFLWKEDNNLKELHIVSTHLWYLVAPAFQLSSSWCGQLSSVCHKTQPPFVWSSACSLVEYQWHLFSGIAVWDWNTLVSVRKNNLNGVCVCVCSSHIIYGQWSMLCSHPVGSDVYQTGGWRRMSLLQTV